MENSSSEENSLFSQVDRKPVLKKSIHLPLPSTHHRYKRKSIKNDMPKAILPQYISPSSCQPERLRLPYSIPYKLQCRLYADTKS